MRTLLLLCFLAIYCSRATSQTSPDTVQSSDQECDCATTFQWIKTTFTENDAGFAYALEQKGRQPYETMTEQATAAIDTVTDPSRCAVLMYEWLSWFRPGHIALRQLDDGQQQQQASVPTDKEIRSRYANWKRIKGPVDDFVASLDPDDDYEGIWITGEYRIGIKQAGDRYVGAIIDADSLYWMPGQIKLEFDRDTMLTYYMQDHSPRYVHAPTLVGRNRLEADWVSLQREIPHPEQEPLIDLYVRASETEVPLFERIDGRTVYLRIPSFEQLKKPGIDSAIAAHREEILSTPNLILDIHSGTGGSDAAFAELLPLLYTNPIREIGVEFYSTPLNNQRMLDFASDRGEWGFDDEVKEWARKSYDTLQQHLGRFVNLSEGREDTTVFDTVHPYPENVAIIIDGGNGSTDEQFLLAAKQSRKVKLYGQSTFGVLDISNMYFVPSPCGDYELGYSLSRSMRIPDFTIDGVGIQPDYFINREVPKSRWIEYVVDLLGE